MKDQDASFILQKMIQEKCGVKVDSDSPLFLHSRLHSLLEFNKLKNLSELVDFLKINPNILDQVIDLVTTHESLFFRDESFFTALRDEIFPYFYEARKKTKQLRIWSAACSYGQEPSSVAMTLLKHPLNFSDWDIKILATDISLSTLERAKKGIFTHFEIQRGLSISLLAQYFDKHVEGYKIHDKVLRMIHFEHINLINPFSHLGQFDIVLIRNVLIYFDVDIKRKILTGVRTLLASDGCLGLGGPETIFGLTDQFEVWGSSASSLYKVSTK